IKNFDFYFSGSIAVVVTVIFFLIMR
ncbi:MAG: hypothetical protein RL480_2458, partial [Pseudomonadota bacterium]